MDSDSDSDSKTLDLISSFSHGGSIHRSSEIQSSSTNLTKKRRKNTDNASNDHTPKKVKRKEIVFSATIPMPTPLRHRIAEIGGSDIKIVIQKQLQDTDLNKNHDRLSIPIKKMLCDFATEEEKNWLMQQREEDSEKNKNEMKVVIIDPALRESLIGLKLWKIESDDNYCLVSEWNSLAERNLLESGDYIQLWSFRYNEGIDLSFALVKLDISEGIFKFI